jgi:hypothetical protein
MQSICSAFKPNHKKLVKGFTLNDKFLKICSIFDKAECEKVPRFDVIMVIKPDPN